MRMLKLAVVVMGVLIFAGVTLLSVVVARRSLSVPGPLAPVVLDEPAGTHIVGVSTLSDRLVLRLQGGGADRVVVVDLRSGGVVGRVGLAR
jgi:hypothetical protein